MNEARAGNVRHPVWQGVQEVAALWFSSDWLDDQERDSRMLAAWRPGCRAWRFALGDVLVFPQPRIAACESLPGLALCRILGGLYSAPLTAREATDLAAADLGLVVGAQVIALRFQDAHALDLSEKLDVGDYALHDTYDCRVDATPTSPRLDGKSLRTLLGNAVPPASPDGENLLASLSGKRPVGGDRGKGGGAGSRVAEGVAGALHSVLSRALPWLGFGAGAKRAHGTGGQGDVAARQQPPAPQGWRAALARLALASRISSLIGYRHGAYLNRMMRLFEEGNLDEALRNALPLGGLNEAIGQAFSTPGRREDLGLSRRAGTSVAMGLGEDLEAQLRQMYRKAFEAYDRRGRIDEAVFVLAELLNARQEALDYLVRHGRAAQAAELALGWDMPAATIIRLLMLAGDGQRALQVARRDSAFSAAIQLLQHDHPDLADRLRIDWGHALVANGDWLGAVDVVWPLPQARDQAMEWLLAAERSGGELSARALVQRAALLPDTLERYAGTIEALADPGSNEEARTAMAEALVSMSRKGRALSGLATLLLPAISADCTAGRNAFTRKELDALLALSGDACLQADLPAWKLGNEAALVPIWNRDSPLELSAGAPGLHPVHDAVSLPGRRYLVALGEAGAAVLDSKGKVVQRYGVPAFRLVGSASGHVALAIAPRERVARISRLDLVSHAIGDLGVMPLSFAASSFNGIAWTVVSEQRILVLDTCSPSREALWHVDGLGGPVLLAGFFAQREIFLVRGTDAWRDWTYTIPARRLLPHTDFQPDPERPLLLHPATLFLQPDVRVLDGRVQLHYRMNGFEHECVLCELPGGEGVSASYVALERGLVVALEFDGYIDYFVVAFPGNQVAARIRWPGGVSAQVREHGGQIIFHDAEGRLLHLDPETAVARRLGVR